jgi:hypothetical protein
MDNSYAIVQNGSVVNVVIWDGDAQIWQPPAGATATQIPVGSAAGIGYSFDGANFVAPSK